MMCTTELGATAHWLFLRYKRFEHAKASTLDLKARPFPKMRIPIFAHGASPHTSAPLWYEREKKLAQLRAEKAVIQIGNFFFKAADSRQFLKRAEKAERDWAKVETGHEWQIVGQTKPGLGPGFPRWSLVR